MQPDPTDRQPTEVPEPKTFEEAMGHLTRERQQHAHTNSELDRARKEAASYRVGARGQLAVHARTVAGLLGDQIAPDADPPAFDDLVPRLETALKGDAIKAKDGEIRSLRLRAILSEKIHDLGLQRGLTRAALIDQGHMEKLSAAVEAADIDEQVTTTLEELSVNMPALRGTGTSPTRTSAPFRPPQHDPEIKREDLKGMDENEIAAALRSGKLDSILGRS